MEKLCSKKFCFKGFSLVELLVSISIIGLLFGLAVAYYAQFNRRQVVSQAAKTFKNDLRLVQSKALAGIKDSAICISDTDKLDGWFLRIETSSTYSIYGSCASKVFGTQTINLSGVTFQSPAPSTVIQFVPLGRGVDSDRTIILSGFGGTITQSIVISISGDIN